jgi:hypothetical protein
MVASPADDFSRALVSCEFSSHSGAFWATCRNCGKGLEYHEEHHQYALSDWRGKDAGPHKFPSPMKKPGTEPSAPGLPAMTIEASQSLLRSDMFNENNLDFIMSLSGLCNQKRVSLDPGSPRFDAWKAQISGYFPAWTDENVMEGIERAVKRHNKAASPYK